MATITITKENFDSEVMSSDKPVLLDFWAAWCVPCRMMSPVVDKVADERPDYKVGKVNVDEQPGDGDQVRHHEHPHDHPLQRRSGGQEGDRGTPQGRPRARAGAVPLTNPSTGRLTG